MARVLIVEDDQRISDIMAVMLKQMHHTVACVETVETALNALRSQPFDVVLLDVNLPDGSGLALLPDIRNLNCPPDVIILTGAGTAEGAETAIKNGAWDYLAKPLHPSNLILALNRLLQYRAEKAKAEQPLVLKREGIIGNSSNLRACFELVAKAAATESNVLITGETGTGKELFARAIHSNSNRSEKPFVIVDCGALPDTLVESILFGHEKGAFTHAIATREGLVKQADEGTLFLDEIGELPLDIQSAFLRVLQERRFRPVGGDKEVKTDFRLIAATNRDLQQMVVEGRFRKDLFFRIQSMLIQLPSLRERREDIEALVNFYLTKFCDNYGIAPKAYSPDFMEALKSYQWPGNVRELINILERSIPISNEEKTLFPFHLPQQIRLNVVKSAFDATDSKTVAPSESNVGESGVPDLKTLIEKTEKKYFEQLILVADWDIEKICTLSGLSRANVYNRLKKYHLKRNNC